MLPGRRESILAVRSPPATRRIDGRGGGRSRRPVHLTTLEPHQPAEEAQEGEEGGGNAAIMRALLRIRYRRRQMVMPVPMTQFQGAKVDNGGKAWAWFLLPGLSAESVSTKPPPSGRR